MTGSLRAGPSNLEGGRVGSNPTDEGNSFRAIQFPYPFPSLQEYPAEEGFFSVELENQAGLLESLLGQGQQGVFGRFVRRFVGNGKP
jgi:hypothetical protein